jgi:enoyl-CoA hydratase/carnithine racemase
MMAGADYDEYIQSVATDDRPLPGSGEPDQFAHDLVWHWTMGKPTIAAINGACAGISFALASYCDLRFGAQGARMTTATPRLGLPAEYGLDWILPRIVGLTNAADILLTGRILLADELGAMGFFNAVVPADEVLAKAYEAATYIARNVAPRSAQVAKRQLYTSLIRSDIGTIVEDSKALIGEFMNHADFREGVQAQLEVRPPSFLPI